MMTLDDVLSRLDVRHRTNGTAVCLCPAHDDSDPSLTVSAARNGGVVMYCHAGCETEAILSRIGITWVDVNPPKANRPAAAPVRRETPLPPDFWSRDYQALQRTGNNRLLSDPNHELVRIAAERDGITLETLKRYRCGILSDEQIQKVTRWRNEGRDWLSLPYPTGVQLYRRTSEGKEIYSLRGSDTKGSFYGGNRLSGSDRLVLAKSGREVMLLSQFMPDHDVIGLPGGEKRALSVSQTSFIREISDGLQSIHVVMDRDTEEARKESQALCESLAAVVHPVPVYMVDVSAATNGRHKDVTDVWRAGEDVPAIIGYATPVNSKPEGIGEADGMPTIYTAADALEPQPPIQWRVEGLISEASLCVAPGVPGGGKTYLLIDMCVCHATGTPWLSYETYAAPTLIVDEESGRRRLSGRIGAVMRARGAGADTPLYYVTLEGYNLCEDAGAARLLDVIEQTGAKLVLVDTLAAITPGANENAVEDMQPVMMRLRKIAESAGAAIVVIHHTNKVGDYRGSSSILGAVDLMLMIEPKGGNSGNVEVRSAKTRDSAPVKFAAHLRFEGEPYRIPDKVFVAEVEPDSRSNSWSAGEEYVLRYLSENGASEVKTIMDNADTCAPATARKSVYSLAKLKEIVRIDSGGSGDSATYDLRSNVEKVPF